MSSLSNFELKVDLVSSAGDSIYESLGAFFGSAISQGSLGWGRRGGQEPFQCHCLLLQGAFLFYLQFCHRMGRYFRQHLNSTFSTSSMVAGIGLSFVSGRMNVMRPEVMAIDRKMRVGMIGLISARAATVVDKVPPTLDTREEDPTPAALTVVGMSSPVYM